MSIPQGPQIIKCVAYHDRVADLSKARVGNAVIGFRQHNNFNQKWIFDKEEGTTSEYKIFTTSEDGNIAFAHTAVEEGAVIVGRPFAGVFFVEATDQGNVRILPKENAALCWTLDREAEETQITLQRYDRPNTRSNQRFVILPA